MTVYIYARFSPRRNEEDCESIEVQVDRCVRYAEQLNLEVGRLVTDRSVSGGTPIADREGGSKIVDNIRRGDHVIAQRVDRMFRDTVDGLSKIREWTNLGVTIHLADQGGCSINCSTAVGRWFITNLLSMAEFEKNLTAEKTSGAMKHHQANGRRMSHHAPYGWEVDEDDRSRLIENKEEQDAIERIVELRSEGMSYGEIAERIWRMGHPSRSGQWHSETVRRIYTRHLETK